MAVATSPECLAEVYPIGRASAPGEVPLPGHAVRTRGAEKTLHPSRLFMASGEGDIVALAGRIIRKVKLEERTDRKLADNVRWSDREKYLSTISRRLYHRAERQLRMLIPLRSPTLRAMGAKADVMLAMEESGWEGPHIYALALSIAKDALNLSSVEAVRQVSDDATMFAAPTSRVGDGTPPDPRAVDAYHQFLHLELRYLEHERGMPGGVPWSTAAQTFHDDALTPGHTPSTRAECVLSLLGIDWTKEKLPLTAPLATEAA